MFTAKKILMWLMVIGVVFTVSFQSAQAALLKDNPRIIVLPIKDKASKTSGLNLVSTSVSEFLIDHFAETGRFKIVEREELKAVQNEYAINTSELGEPATAFAVGKFTGAQYLVAGSVTGLSTKKSGVEISHSSKGGATFNEYAVIANINIRIIDLEDGTIVMTAKGTGESSQTNTEFKLSREAADYFDDGDNYDSGDGYPGAGTPTENEPTVEPFDTASPDENFGEDPPSEEGGGGVETFTISIGGKTFSMVQVHNALDKAAYDAINNKDYGIIAKMDGTNKKRKV